MHSCRRPNSELGETVRAQLTRMRFAAKCVIDLEEHSSTIVLGGRRGDPEPRLRQAGGRGAGLGLFFYMGDADLERLRIEAAYSPFRQRDRRPRSAGGGRSGRARGVVHQGLLPRPGADRASQHYRGKVNRSPARPRGGRSRVPEARDRGRPRREGRSAASRAPWPGLALAYVRVEVPDDAVLKAASRLGAATLIDRAPVAQGIEHQLAELGVARSNRAGRTDPYGVQATGMR